ncbi:threonine--tRNA ligase [bacterium]|nr:threonine--tRNA ligase [bacterium]
MTVASSQPVQITLPDGSVKTFDGPTTGAQIAGSIGAGLAKAAVAVLVDGVPKDLSAPIAKDAAVSILTAKSPEALEILRHSCTHLMAQAVKRLRPNALLEDGPPTEEGFWYDIKTEPPLTPEDFDAIEKIMAEIVKEALPIERIVLSRDDARTLFSARGEKYKLDLIERIPEGDTISAYKQGEFVDLCRGPHVPTTGIFKAFKLMSVAGAYWKGDARNDQLTRVKGTAFFTEKELAGHLQMLEEAKKRDHRKLGRELELFMHHDWAPGETFWLNKGNLMYKQLSRMMSELCREEGYEEVFTPMLFKVDLFRMSGHWDHYRDNMFVVPGQDSRTLEAADIAQWAARLEAEAATAVPAEEWNTAKAELAKLTTASARLSFLLKLKQVGGKHWNLFEKAPGVFVTMESAANGTYALKPMNCPSHMLVFRDRRRSYRELPLRIHDQGVLHRNEASGTLGGLTRVRQFCQDDAHIFLAQEQIEQEITQLISLIKRVYTAFGMEFARVFLSTRPDDFLGEKETWDRAEKALENSIRANGMEFKINAGDGAFYGPKIDFIVRDCLNREWQTATIQLDYQLPARFGLKFVNRNNEDEQPVVVHRAIFGSFERFFGILIEHFGGNFPTWLAPVQARVLTISDKYEGYATEVFDTLRRHGVRAERDFSAEKIGSKIRDGRNMRIPYLLVVGEKEEASRSVAVRSQTEGELGAISLDDFLARIDKEKAIRF